MFLRKLGRKALYMGNGRRMSIGIQDIPFNNVTGKRFSGGQVEKAITRIHIVDPATTSTKWLKNTLYTAKPESAYRQAPSTA